MQIRGTSALVTGAGRGIGRAVALALAAEGASVTIVSRTAGDLDALAGEIEKAGGTAHAFPADLQEPHACRAAVEAAVRTGGGLQILVNNAGIGAHAPVAETSDELWDRILATNLSSVFRLTRAALPHLTKAGGHVFMVSSLAGSNPIAGMAAYCASKAALDHWSRCLMLEVRERGVKVTVLAPGSVDTGFGTDGGTGGGSPWKLQPEDLAGAVVDLLHTRDAAHLSRVELRPADQARGVIFRHVRAASRVAWRAFLRFQDHHGPDRAAAVAYYTLLSLVPLLIFLISIGVAVLGSFDAAYQGSMLLVRGVVIHLSPASMEALRAFVEQAQRFHWPGLLLLAWTARRIFASLFSALETVFGVPGRSFAKHNLVALSMVMVAGIALLLTMAFTMLSATSEGFILRLRASGELHSLGLLLGRVLPLLVTFLFFFLVYRFVPRKATDGRQAAIGAILATTMWEGAKAAFAYYIRNVAQYSGVYGTLEGIIVLALWLELSVSIILYCGEVVALLIHQRAVARKSAAETPVTATA